MSAGPQDSLQTLNNSLRMVEKSGPPACEGWTRGCTALRRIARYTEPQERKGLVLRQRLDSPDAPNCGGQVNRSRMTTQGCSIMKRWAVQFIIGFRCAVSNFNGYFRHAMRSRQAHKEEEGQ
jgi:hypothetical protein